MADRFPRQKHRRPGLDVTLGRSEMALIYELRQEGVQWKLISMNFGISVDWLIRLTQRCRKEGLDWLKKP